MKRTKPTATKVVVEKAVTRYVPDPHRRHRTIENKKLYNRKARPNVGPSDVSGSQSWIFARSRARSRSALAASMYSRASDTRR
jgi:hypothetical protein